MKALFYLPLFVIFLILSASGAFAQHTNEVYPDTSDFIALEKLPEVDIQAIAKLIIYPELARRANVEGKVVVRVFIDKTGKPLQSKIYSSDSHLLDTTAMNAVMNVSYTPAIQNKQPIACWFSIPVTFRLRDVEGTSIFNTNTTEPKKEPPVTEPK